MIRDIRNLFEKEEDYNKPVSVGNFYSKNYVEYETNCDRNKTLSIKKYFDEIKPYLKDIANLKKSDAWKIQFRIKINFIASKDTDKEHVTHSVSDNIEIIIYDKEDEAFKGLFESLLSRYQTGLKTLMKGTDFIFDYVHFLYYKCHKISLNHCGLYKDSPDWIKSNDNFSNDDDKWF